MSVFSRIQGIWRFIVVVLAVLSIPFLVLIHAGEVIIEAWRKK